MCSTLRRFRLRVAAVCRWFIKGYGLTGLRMNLNSLAVALSVFIFLVLDAAHASVVVTGTRVIYSEGDKVKTVNLMNEDSFPNVVQAWIDIDNPSSMPDSADAPFLVMPSVFRMEPKSGNSLRITYSGEGLPKDRESLFYLNILQIPPRNEKNTSKNQMLLMVRNQLKLFYRPDEISDEVESLAGKLEFRLRQEGGGWIVRVSNPTGYFASFSKGAVISNGHVLPLDVEMIAPRSEGKWMVNGLVSSLDRSVSINCFLINDYGAQVEISRELK